MAAHENDIFSKLKPLDDQVEIRRRKKIFALMQAVPGSMPAHTKNRLRGKIGDYLYQAVVTGVIFGVFFVIINWSALVEVAGWNVKKLKGQVPLQGTFTQTVTQQPSASEPLPIAKTPQEAQSHIPKLNITVAPPDTRLIIPRIGKNVPVMSVTTQALLKRDWKGLERDIQESLQYGVIHYPGTARPGQQGNVVITGHSSYFPWDPGRFKDVFAILQEVQKGDAIILYADQKKYIYEVTTIKTVWPDAVDILKPTIENKLTLITCTPLGTNLKRLIVEASLKKVES